MLPCHTRRLPLLALPLLPVLAIASGPEDVSLTVYNQDMALVREVRVLDLGKGLAPLRLEDVAARIDPTSVHFGSLTAPGRVRVLEQNFEFDLVHPAKLLEKYLGGEVEVVRRDPKTGGVLETLRGRLLSTGWEGTGGDDYRMTGQPTLEIGGKIHLSPPGELVLPDLPEGLVTKPSLAWALEVGEGGRHRTELSYITRGIDWSADYVAVTDPRAGKLDLTGWVTLTNRTGATYRDARLKLVAGDVNVIQPPSPRKMAFFAMEERAMGAPAQQFEERSFAEYHLYELQRRTTVKDNEQKQVELLNAPGVPYRKVFVYDGAAIGRGWGSWGLMADPRYGTETNKKVYVMIEFWNRETHGLGMPLPKGKIRVFEADADGSQEFAGEDLIDHTPKDEKLRLYVGNAFDLVGERKQTNFNVISEKVIEESFEIIVRNHKKEPVEVRVVEHLYRWSEWKIVSSSADNEKTDSRTVEFRPVVPPGGEARITYTVRYNW